MNWMRSISVTLLSLFFLASCQEEKEYHEDDYSDALNKNSALTGLVTRVVQNPTAWDDVMDDNSHFNVVLPVNVQVNNQNVQVTATNDGLEQIFDIKSMSNSDDDIVHFQFPITVKFRNYQTQTVLNQSEYNQLISSLGPCTFLDEISCVKLQYPVVITTYDSSSQEADSFTFTNNSGLYAFLNNLDSNDTFNFSYPFSVLDNGNTSHLVNSDVELNQLIEDNIGQCPAYGGTNPAPDFISLLTNNQWYVSYCYNEHVDKTSYYTGYYFNFYANGTSKAIKNATQITGDWTKYQDGNKQKLDLSFSGNTLEYMEEDWEIIEYTTTLIRLKHTSGGGSEIDYLYLTKY
ncbi:MAG: hypothetical protein RLZZ500_112 [Bacteroidota bacterium]|jgi:hypothetical protein